MIEQAGFGEVLRAHRRSARLTLEKLAEVSGVSARALSDMERGRSTGPQHRTVTALADALALEGEARRQLIDLAREGRLQNHWARPGGLCELPGAVADFTGRSAELIWMSELVYAEISPGVGVVGLITGSPGLGKTSFAVRGAHSVRPSFPGGVYFIDLFGMSQRPLPSDDALSVLLRALGVPAPQVPGDVQERASLYRSLLHDKRALVVLDNAASEEQVRPLLPATGVSRALVTSRRLLAGLEGVRRLVLGPLALPDSMRLLTGVLGERAASDEESALTRLAELCGGLPLALRIIGNRLASRPGWDAAELAGRLTDEEGRLDQFKAGDLKIANAFGMSYEQLSERARRLFRRLAVVPGRDFDAALAAVAGGMPMEDAWNALDDLVDLGLLQDSSAGRYRFHDLVRLFARNRFKEEEPPAGREAVTRTVTSWLLRTATMAGRWFEPGYGRPARPAPDLAVLASADEADWWLRVNVDNWVGAMRTATSSSAEHFLVLDCAESMHWFSERWVHSPHWHEVFMLGSQAAAALGDLAQQATQLNYMAWVHSVPPADPEAALRCADEALKLATRGGATAQVAWSLEYTAGALLQLGRPGEAITFSLRAAESFRSIGDTDCYVQCLANVAHCLRSQGRYAEALEQYRSGLALMDDESSGMTPSVATHSRPFALIRIGQCLGHLGRRTEAISLLDALQLSDFRQAGALEELAMLLAEEGRTTESGLTYLRAGQVYEAIGDTEAHRRCHALATAGS
ncbi:XRE family transcriptional regulator [Streptomyces durmitorensis]|uniref:Tetratricopeptide repeat protein n=1 Tax=Streptomyces durmitorensis TaxID=319947 RepID=A0ABY4Q3K0_9ACTN|nr:XRE family transcriptional regulator [Streptomyces durmitorensis]UQT60758.1 tetratricopeptide repeat protein [Streptomyces durmitorensis]